MSDLSRSLRKREIKRQATVGERGRDRDRDKETEIERDRDKTEIDSKRQARELGGQFEGGEAKQPKQST